LYAIYSPRLGAGARKIKFTIHYAFSAKKPSLANFKTIFVAGFLHARWPSDRLRHLKLSYWNFIFVKCNFWEALPIWISIFCC